jgi:hypothetical protein
MTVTWSTKRLANKKKEKGYFDLLAVFGQVDADYNVSLAIKMSNKEY